MSFVIASFFYETSCIFLKIKDKSEKATLKRKFFKALNDKVHPSPYLDCYLVDINFLPTWFKVGHLEYVSV